MAIGASYFIVKRILGAYALGFSALTPVFHTVIIFCDFNGFSCVCKDYIYKYILSFLALNFWRLFIW